MDHTTDAFTPSFKLHKSPQHTNSNILFCQRVFVILYLTLPYPFIINYFLLATHVSTFWMQAMIWTWDFKLLFCDYIIMIPWSPIWTWNKLTAYPWRTVKKIMLTCHQLPLHLCQQKNLFILGNSVDLCCMFLTWFLWIRLLWLW